MDRITWIEGFTAELRRLRPDLSETVANIIADQRYDPRIPPEESARQYHHNAGPRRPD
jgi:hypothetical protein